MNERRLVGYVYIRKSRPCAGLGCMHEGEPAMCRDAHASAFSARLAMVPTVLGVSDPRPKGSTHPTAAIQAGKHATFTFTDVKCFFVGFRELEHRQGKVVRTSRRKRVIAPGIEFLE